MQHEPYRPEWVDRLPDAVATSTNAHQAALELAISPGSGPIIKKYIAVLELDTSHWLDTPLKRLRSHVNIDDDTGCWIWTGFIADNGYGKCGGNSGWAHRASYELHKGPIPNGLQLDHLCRNRACVNPDHLEVVTPQENVRRGLTGVLKTHCAQGHPWTPENWRWRPDGKRDCKVCNREASRRIRERKAAAA